MVIASAEDPTLFKGAVSIGNPLDLAQAEQRVQASWLARHTFLNSMIAGRI